jgi:hypothetical protein
MSVTTTRTESAPAPPSDEPLDRASALLPDSDPDAPIRRFTSAVVPNLSFPVAALFA